ncbi:MAG: inositol phosphorylceramide synthase [Flavisolibacter sp.]|jgi:membrane-associated phospholipid phosphatase|nr:inositol phosphorylceramide synthase [Flavisolibacter sp.]
MFRPETERKEKIISHAAPLAPSQKFYSLNKILLAALASLGYILLSNLVVGYRSDHLALVLLFNLLYFSSQATRSLILGFTIIIVYWILFDYMKAFPNYLFNDVHIKSLYDLEKELFGISSGGAILTPNEYFSKNNFIALDLLSGFFYFCWIPVPVLFGTILFFRNRRIFFEFSLTFFFANLLGFIGYYAFPAAPPWYVAFHGFDFVADTPGHAAGLSRFDAYFGVELFKGIYDKSSNVFAAMPSMHSAFMLIVLYYGIKSGFRYYNLVFALIMMGIWFTAVYSGHHYFLDVLAGILTAIIAIAVFQLLANHSRSCNSLINWFMKLTRARKPTDLVI